MNDEPLLKDRMLAEIERTVQDPEEAKRLRDSLVALFNEHSRDLAMLNWNEKDRIKRLEKMIDFKKSKLAERDEAKEAQKREDLGERYNDYLNGEISSLEWAIKFIKEHAV